MRQHRQRSGLVHGVLALGLLAGAALTAGLAQAASGPGPYYAEPAWDQKLPAETRFLVLTNWNSDAVLDKETGLVWERLPSGTEQTWDTARFRCMARTTGNRIGWRLPSVHELASLVHPSVTFPGPTLQPGHPFLNVMSTESLFYWSATTFSGDPTDAYFVLFNTGLAGNANKTSSLRSWCVRGGNNADVY